MRKKQEVRSQKFDIIPHTSYLLLHILILSGIIILTVIIYWGSLKNGFTNWDDNSLVTGNKDIQVLSFSGIIKIFSSLYQHAYDPLRILSYSLIYYFFGFNPAAFHSANIFFHLLNIILVYVFIYKLTSPQSTDHSPQTTEQLKTNNEQRITISAFVACLFAIHPMHTESICWISALCDPQYSFYYLASLIFYLKYIQKSTDHSPQSIDRGMRSEVRSQKKNYLIALLLFVCSCLSKSMAVTLPVILILLDYYKGSWKMEAGNWKYWLQKAPFFIIALVFGIIAIKSEKFTDLTIIHYSLINKFFILTYSISFYVINLIAPLKLSEVHPSPEIIQGLLPVKYYLSSLLIIFLIVLVLKIKNKRKEIIFGALFFFFTISVVLIVGGNVRYVQVAERYTYLPYLGLLFIIAIFVSPQSIVHSPQTKGKWQNIKSLIIIIFILFFSIISYNRNKVWSNSYSLINDFVKKYPKSEIAYLFRASLKFEQGDKEGAIQDINKVIEIKPKDAYAFNNRGLIKASMGDRLGALSDYNKSIEINHQNAEVFNNRGRIKNSIGDEQGALQDYNKAIEINPEFAQAYINRGNAKGFLGDRQGAIQDYNKAFEINQKFSHDFNRR
jgi:protein O-mannosyl-transferase